MSVKGFMLPMPEEDEVMREMSGGELDVDGSRNPISEDFSLVFRTRANNKEKANNRLLLPVSNKQEWEVLFKDLIDEDFTLTVSLPKTHERRRYDHPLRKLIGNIEQWNTLKEM